MTNFVKDLNWQILCVFFVGFLKSNEEEENDVVSGQTKVLKIKFERVCHSLYEVYFTYMSGI